MYKGLAALTGNKNFIYYTYLHVCTLILKTLRKTKHHYTTQHDATQHHTTQHKANIFQ